MDRVRQEELSSQEKRSLSREQSMPEINSIKSGRKRRNWLTLTTVEFIAVIAAIVPLIADQTNLTQAESVVAFIGTIISIHFHFFSKE